MTLYASVSALNILLRETEGNILVAYTLSLDHHLLSMRLQVFQKEIFKRERVSFIFGLDSVDSTLP